METLHTTVLILHILGAAIIIGVALVSLIIEIKKYQSGQILGLTELIWKIAGAALGLQLLTGIYLAVSEWNKVGKLPYFWVKLFLFFVVGGLVGIYNKRRFEEMKKGKKADTTATSWAFVGFLIFITIASLGVLIAESVH